MPAEIAYIDTSALAKRYVDEPGSEAFDEFLHQRSVVLISRLVVVELHCLLARRRRARDITAGYERAALADFEEDVGSGYLHVEPLLDEHALHARTLTDRLRNHPLRALDAIHLAIAELASTRILATADRVMARAAGALGHEVVFFGRPG